MTLAHASLTQSPATLRPASDADLDVLATIWHHGWRDAHLGHMPAALYWHRRWQDLRRLLPARLGGTTVATIGPTVVGFVTVHGDEVEQVYVGASARGTGVAAALLTRAEAVVGTRSDRAWLAVVAGNARARRFYERQGWSDTGPYDNPAPVPGAAPIPVPTRRYEKRLTG